QVEIKRAEPCSVQNSVPESRLIKLSDFLGSVRLRHFFIRLGVTCLESCKLINKGLHLSFG
ncbi:hypothetical protein, partial [Neisseria meningitidis]|uniref:hypothetical protein n=1 Tax=Neisseria meningitidis TaxID=487 RepID=UPI001E493C1F